MPIYENKPPSWPYTLDYKLFHDCMIPPCPTRSYPGKINHRIKIMIKQQTTSYYRSMGSPYGYVARLKRWQMFNGRRLQ